MFCEKNQSQKLTIVKLFSNMIKKTNKDTLEDKDRKILNM